MPSYARTLNTTYEEVDVTTIKTHPANPRRGNLDVIKDSISVNGFYGSVVVNKRTSHILAGNHRYMAAKALGYDKVPVTWVDVGEHEEKRILTADNRTSELGGYDEAILADLLKELSSEEMLQGTGYDADDILALDKKLTDDFRLPEHTPQQINKPIWDYIIEIKCNQEALTAVTPSLEAWQEEYGIQVDVSG